MSLLYSESNQLAKARHRPWRYHRAGAPGLRPLLAGVVLFSLLVYSWCQAVDRLDLQLGRLTAGEWRVEGVRLEISWRDGDAAHFTLSADQLTHPDLEILTGPLSLTCIRGNLSDLEIRCDDGQLDLPSPVLDDDHPPVRFHWRREAGVLTLELPELAAAGGRLAVSLQGSADRWRLHLEGTGLTIEGLRDAMSLAGVSLPPFEATGNSNLKIDLEGDGSGLAAATWTHEFGNLSFSGPHGRYLGDGLSGGWQGRVERYARGIRGRQSLLVDGGALLTPFFYLEPAGDRVTAETSFSMDAALQALSVERFTFDHAGLLGFSADGVLALKDGPRLVRLQLRSRAVPLGAFYSRYLKPVLAANFFQNLSPSGQLQLQLDVDSDVRMRLDLSQVGLVQGERDGTGGDNFLVDGINGSLIWDPARSDAESRLTWRRAVLLGSIPLGAATAEFRLEGNGMRLLRPFALPVLDGNLQLERLRIEQTETGPDVDFQGYITPISMQLVSEALGWPPLAGQLSGMIPGVSYSKRILQLRGVTLIRLFDGRILLRNLVLEDLFGVLPVLQANVEIQDVDLKTLTSTFSFGKITGKIGGRIDALRLENWQPVSFDASLSTPQDDAGPHRISQEAVDNISNLGGAGITGAVSRGFLSVFKEFGYDRLGITCRLERGVCEMGGVQPAKAGYYLVKGGGIPRIDIIGFNQRTDWEVLLGKLRQISEGGTPIIK